MSESAPASIPAPEMPSAVRLIATLGLIALISGFTIVLVYQVTLEPIAQNHRDALERAVLRVLPGATQQANFRWADGSLTRLADDDIGGANLFAGFDATGQLVGIALEAAARGYAGEVRILYGYAPDREVIIGYTVLQSSETPGLGDKIETDRRFLANFDALDVALADDGESLRNPVRLVPQGTKQEPWEIDGITGATVSCRAVERALLESLRTHLPPLRPHLLTLDEPAGGDPS